VLPEPIEVPSQKLAVADVLDQSPIVSLKKQAQIASEQLHTLARAPQTRPRVGGFDLWRAKAGNNLLRPSVIRLRRSGSPAISVGIYGCPTGASNESNQDIQADR